MKRFTNVNIKKEHKKKIRTLIIGIILILASFGFKCWELQTIENANEKITDLNSIIISKEEKTSKKAYLDAKSIPYKFAVYEDTTDSYYIVSDGTYLYIVYMSPTDYEKLNKKDIKENPIRIEGVTATTTKDIQKLAIDAYNQGLKPEEKLTLADFKNYFGEVYLNMTVQDSSVAAIPVALFILSLMFGVIILIVALAELISFNKAIKKLDGVAIDDLDKEMNDKEAFYYDRAHLYLTEHYIINFGGFTKIIKYEDILWMYKFEQRTNGIKTAQSLKVLTTDCKTSTIANIDLVTKKKREVYDEICNTIYNKNNKILVGYTKENIKAMKEKVKELRKNK